MKELKKCAICGTTGENKIITMVHGTPMCSKHKAQFYRHGKIIDKTPRTTQDKNQIIPHEDYSEMIVRNKTNKKEYHILIDSDDVEKVSSLKWRIEFSNTASNGYVVSGNTKNGRILLHRYVMGYSGDLQIDHINRNTFDNRKINLRVVPQVINMHNLTMRNNNIEQRANNKYRVKIIRFKREFIFGLFDTIQEAENVRDEFLEFIANHEKEMTENYYNEKLAGHIRTTFQYNNKTVHTKMFKTVSETIENREDLKSLLKQTGKTA